MQLAVIMAIGIVAAWRVALETKQRQIAERTSASLGFLNMVGDMLSNTMDVEQRLPRVVDELVTALDLQAAILTLGPEATEAEPVVIRSGSPNPCEADHGCPFNQDGPYVPEPFAPTTEP